MTRWLRRGCGVLVLLSAPAAADWQYVQRPLSLTLTTGRVVEVDLRVPEGLDGPFPAIMLFAGFEAAGHVLELLPPKAPVVKASFAYPLDVPARMGSYRQRLAQLPAARDSIPLTFEAIGRLHEALRALPEVDAERIVVAGVSLGAPFALISAEQHDIPGLVVIHGFGDIPATIQHLIRRRTTDRLGWFSAPVSSLLTRYIHWYARLPDLEAHARRLGAQQRVLVIDAEADRMVPRSAQAALHRALDASEAQVSYRVTPGGHVNEGADELIAKILRQMMDWMVAEALLSPV